MSDTPNRAIPASSARYQSTRTARVVLRAGLLVAGSFYDLAQAETTRPEAPRLNPGEWYEIPDSRLQSAAYRWPPNIRTTMNGIGVAGVMSSWSGGALDSRRDRLVVWGGGHFAYAGNEIYAFGLRTGRWSLASQPSLAVDMDYRAGDEVYSDETPRSNHTYGAILHVPTIDRFCSFGTAANFPASRSGPTTWCFDFETSRWERRSPLPDHGFGTSSAWDPVANQVWVRLNGRKARLLSWDPESDSWTERGANISDKTWYDHSAAIDPLRRRYVAVGGGKIRAYDLALKGPIPQVDLKTTGPQDIVRAASPGFEYDPIIDRFVGWAGGPDVLTLDPDSLEWKKVPAAATNRTSPTAPAANGTFGRFRYVPSTNHYVLVNSVNENVFLLRLSDLAHQPPPKRLTAAAKSRDPRIATWAARQIARFHRQE